MPLDRFLLYPLNLVRINGLLLSKSPARTAILLLGQMLHFNTQFQQSLIRVIKTMARSKESQTPTGYSARLIQTVRWVWELQYKSGYYATHIGYQFYFDDKRRNPTFTAILKKIGKPIAMDAKPIIVELNIFKKTGPPPIAFTNTAGYDLMTGDWVAPYGKGINADIIFTEEFNKKSKTDYYYKLTVSFPDVGDSIQEFDEPLLIQNAQNGQSDLRSLHEAPADGYHSQLVKESYAHSGQPSRSDYNQNAIYYIRVRTKLDVNGNVASAHYGKIYGDFMQFTYYLNPTPNDRNIEFDPKQNLISGLQPVEQVSQP